MIDRVEFYNAKKLWDKAYSKQLLKGPFFQYDWHRIWFETLGTDYAPLTLVFEDGVVLPLAQKEDVVIFSGGDETTDYNDAVGDENLKGRAWEDAVKFLKNNGIKKIQLRNLPEGSSKKYFDSIDAKVEKEDSTPLFSLPDSWDVYLMSLKRKWRKELKRKVNNFHRDNEIVVYEEKGSIDCLIGLMKKNPDKVEFFERPGMEEYFRSIYEAFKSQARLECVSVSGELAATIYYFVTEDSYLLYNSGFDKSKYDSAGFYLKAMNVKRAIEEGMKEYNFLQGEERYKYELGGQDFFVYKVNFDL
ncbi:GNAT family N-acetyltransferase [Patescibacteria group bacterium]